MSILKTRIDATIDIDQCDVKRCSPLIYCFQWAISTVPSIFSTTAHRCTGPAHANTHQPSNSFSANAKPITSAFVFPTQVNYPDADGRFPVHLCTESDFVSGLRILDLEIKSLNPTLLSSQGHHALHWPLNKWKDNRASLEMIAGVLSVKPFDFNPFDAKCNTPLICAITFLKTDLVKLLMNDLRCDVNSCGQEGKTEFLWAVLVRALDVTKLQERSSVFL
jgi:hypothetical protein